MDRLDFMEIKQLLQFLHRNKTELSCMEKPHTFVSQLRDHSFVPEDRYKKVSRMKSKDNLRRALYEILDWVERNRSQDIQQFWKCVFRETIMNQYPTLKMLYNNLMDGSFQFDTKMDEEDTHKNEKLSEDEERETDTVKKKRKRRQSTCDAEEEQPGPSSQLTPVKRKKSNKICFSSPLKKGEKGDIWTWPIYKNQLPVTCGDKEGNLKRDRFARGEKCILVKQKWFTPNEFEKFGGKASYKNWKLSIQCMGTPLGKLIQEGHLPRADFRGQNKEVSTNFTTKRLVLAVHLITDSDQEENEVENNDEDEEDTNEEEENNEDEDTSEEEENNDEDEEDMSEEEENNEDEDTSEEEENNDEAEEKNEEDEENDSDDEQSASGNSKSPAETTDEEEAMEEEAEQPSGSSDFGTMTVFKVTCGDVTATLHKQRFASGSCGWSIRTETSWMTPMDFAKEALNQEDASWRRDIRYEGKPLSALIAEEILKIHSLQCPCRLCKPHPEDLDGQKNDDDCCICKEDSQMKLVECDHCPRSFHQHCHLPHIEDSLLRDDSLWMCTFCVFRTHQESRYDDSVERETALSYQIRPHILQCQYLLLFLCSADEEQLFTLKPSLYVDKYSSFIETLSKVADKLQRNQYQTVGRFVSDVQLIFTNCAKFNKDNDQLLAISEQLNQSFEREFTKAFSINE